MTHHPHVHMIVPGWRPSPLMVRAGCRAARDFFLPVRVLSRLFRRLFPGQAPRCSPGWTPRVLRRPRRACRAASICCLPGTAAQGRVGGRCQEAVRRAAGPCSPTCRATPTASPSQNRRLISADKTGVTFKWKDYRIEGPDRYKTMTLPTGEFIRRFSDARTAPRACTASATTDCSPTANRARQHRTGRASCLPCRAGAKTGRVAHDRPPLTNPACYPVHAAAAAAAMIIIETFAGGCQPKHHPASAAAAIEDRHLMILSPLIHQPQ